MRRLALLLALCLPVASFAQPLRVLDVSPTAHAVTAERTAPVSLTFDRAVDPATTTTASVRVFGRWSGPATGTLTVDDATVQFVPDAPFFAGETVTVSVSRAVRGTGGAELDHGYAWSFWTRTRAASLDLVETGQLSTRRPGEGLVRSYGAYGGDLDGDGWSDLAIPNEVANDLRVFLNDGTGGYGDFAIHALPSGSVPSTNEGGDFDGDGAIDLAVGNIGNDRVSVMLGDGTGGFRDGASYQAGRGVRGLCTLDLDGDGHDDLVTANRSASTVTILRGQGDGTFAAPEALETGTNGETACAAADANGDGLTDVFIGSITSGEITLLLGDGEGLTVGPSVPTGANPWMLAAGDLDGDGDVDVAAASGSNSNNVVVVRGDGAGGLGAAERYSFGRLSVAIDLGDLDGDGDLDLVSSNFSSSDFDLFENLGDGSFADPTSYPVSGNGSCAVFHDRDNDGDLDLTGIDETDDILYFYDNPGSTGTEAGPDAALSVTLYPNPARDRIALDLVLPTPGAVTVRVYDVLGRAVAALAEALPVARTRTIRWATGALPAGAYVVRIEAGGQVVARPLVVTR